MRGGRDCRSRLSGFGRRSAWRAKIDLAVAKAVANETGPQPVIVRVSARRPLSRQRPADGRRLSRQGRARVDRRPRRRGSGGGRRSSWPGIPTSSPSRPTRSSPPTSRFERRAGPSPVGQRRQLPAQHAGPRRRRAEGRGRRRGAHRLRRRSDGGPRRADQRVLRRDGRRHPPRRAVRRLRARHARRRPRSPARACCPAGSTRASLLAFASRCSRCSTRQGRDARATWCSPSTTSCRTVSSWVSTSSTSRSATPSSSRPSPTRWCRRSSRRLAPGSSWWRRPATAASTRSPANPATRASRLRATRRRPSRWARCSRRGRRRRSDDEVAPFSSRGPSWYDAFAKPDIVAPGRPARVGRRARQHAVRAIPVAARVRARRALRTCG